MNLGNYNVVTCFSSASQRRIHIYIYISNCSKGYTKGRLPVHGDTLTYNPYSRTKTITIQNSIYDTITRLNKRAYIIQLQN